MSSSMRVQMPGFREPKNIDTCGRQNVRHNVRHIGYANTLQKSTALLLGLPRPTKLLCPCAQMRNPKAIDREALI